MKYEIDESNHRDWLNKGPWYKTDIYSRLHVSLFEYFITHARTDRYHLMCSLVAHDKRYQLYENDEISIGDRIIPESETIEALEALGTTPNFSDICLQLSEENYDARRVEYINSTKKMFKQIPLTMIKALTPKKGQKFMTEIGGGWYMENFLRYYLH